MGNTAKCFSRLRRDPAEGGGQASALDHGVYPERVSGRPLRAHRIYHIAEKRKTPGDAPSCDGDFIERKPWRMKSDGVMQIPKPRVSILEQIPVADDASN